MGSLGLVPESASSCSSKLETFVRCIWDVLVIYWGRGGGVKMDPTIWRKDPAAMRCSVNAEQARGVCWWSNVAWLFSCTLLDSTFKICIWYHHILLPSTAPHCCQDRVHGVLSCGLHCFLLHPLSHCCPLRSLGSSRMVFHSWGGGGGKTNER